VAARAAAAIGLVDGPIHAELRLSPSGPQLIEIAARSIGGLCARTLRFGLGAQSLEELVIRQALRLPLGALDKRGAAGVMMIPIPRGGVFQSARGVEQAKQVPLIEDVAISAKPGQVLVPLPEGHAYLGFIFARGENARCRRGRAARRARPPRLRHRRHPDLIGGAQVAGELVENDAVVGLLAGFDG